MVLQLDNVDGTENFQPAWASHVPVIRRYTPAIERWRTEVEANMPETLRRRSDAAQLVDKYLWTMSGENAAGDPTLFHDGGNGYGLMADRVSRTPPGSPPDVQIRNAWQLVQNNPKTWTDWGEGSSYQGKPFGALGVIAAYDPSPDAVHPTQGGTSSIRPPNVGEGDLAGATYQPPGWEPPVGYASSAGVPLVEKLRTAREKRLRDTGYIPPEDSSSVAGSLSGSVLSTGKVSPDAYEILQERKKQAEAASAVVEKFANTRSLADIGLGAASNVFSSAVSKLGDLGIDIPNPPMLGAPGSTHRATVGAAAEQAVTPIEPLEAVQDVAGKAGRVAGTFAEYSPAFAAPAFALKKLTGISGGDVGEELGKGLVPTTPAELGLAAITGDFEDAAKLATTAGAKLYDEAAVRLAANETFDRLAPASLLRHERAGAAIAQEAAGIPVNPRSPFARRPGAGGFPIEEWVDENGVAHLGRAPGAGAASAESRRGGAAAGRDFGPEVAGGGAGRKAYGNKVREGYVATLGEDEAVRWEAKLKEQGLDWADYGDMTQPFKEATAAHAVDPGSASVSTAFRGNPNNPADVTREIRRSVADVRAERAGAGTRAQMEAAAARRGGARTGREAGSEVGGGRAGFTPGRPADAQSDEAWAGRVANAKSQALQAAKHRFWYDNSSKGILAMAHGDVADADLITRIAAVGSNQITVPQQGRTILQGWQQWKAGEQVTGAANMRTVSDRVDKALRMSPEEWDNYVIGAIKKGDNQKVTNFWLDMMDDIDPVRAARVREASGATATVDMWMLRAFGYANDQSPTAAQYRTIAGARTDIGKDLGWTPKQVQAAVWVQQIVDSGKPITDAATDYGTAVAAHQAHLRNEILPTPSNPRYENVGMALHRAPPEAVAEYAKSVDEAFRDEQGADILARLLGLPVEPVHGNPLVSGTISKGPARGLANPAQADIVDAYASARAAALGQDEVQWYRPFDLKSAGFHNGVRFDVGRDVTYDDVVALRNELADLDLMYVPGGTQLSVIRPLSEADWAARQANSEAVPAAVTEANKAFRKRVADAAEGYFGGVSAHGQAGTMETFATDGRRFALDGHSLSTSTLGRPDVRAAVDTIAERVSAADDVFAAAYTPGLNAASTEPSAASARLTGARRGREAGSEVAGGLLDATRRARPAEQRLKLPTPDDITFAGEPGQPTLDELGAKVGVDLAPWRSADAKRRVLGMRIDELRQANPELPPKIGDAYNYTHGDTQLAVRNLGHADVGGPQIFEFEVVRDTAGEAAENFAGRGVGADLDALRQSGETINQLRAENPDSIFVSFPTDERRSRIYQRVGWREPTPAELDLPGFPSDNRTLVLDKGMDTALAPPARPTTSWTITPKEGEAYQVETRAGPVSGSVEEARARFARNTADQAALNTRNAVDRRVGAAAQAAEGVAQVRQAGARAGREAGNEVGGGSAFGPGATPATPSATPPPSPIVEAVKGLGRELASTPGAALSTVASYSPQIGRQGLPAFFMNPKRTLRNLGTSLKAGLSETEGVRLLDATLADDWIRSTSEADAAAKAAYDAAYAKAGPVWRANNKPPVAGAGPNAGYTWQDVGGTVLDWRGQAPLEGKSLADLKAIADQHGIDLPKNVTTARAREQIARDLRPELLEGLSQETKVGRATEAFTRPSSRQSAIELNLYRTDWYKGVAQTMKDAGVTDVAEYEKLRKTIEIFTQRGAWKQPFSFPAFFSTRAMSARVQMIERGLDAFVHFPQMFQPGARQEAGKALLALTAGNMTMLAGLYGAASAAGLQPRIEMDGKLPTLTVGDAFHFDPWAGINTPARAVFGVVADTLAAESVADAPQAALASATTRGQRLLRGGLSPLFGKAADTATGRDYTGQKYSLKDDILSGGFARDLVAPMLATSTAEGYAEGGVAGAVATGVPSSLSLSVNAYQRPEDAANQIARDRYGRGYDDLTRDERLAVIGQVPEERAAKALAKVDRASFESDRNKAGYQDYWDTERKQEFYRSNPDLETQAWYHDRRTLQNVETVDKVLAMGIPNREVRFSGVPVDIARDEKTRAAWDSSKDMIEEYSHTIVEKNREAVAQRMYKKDWKALTDSQRSSVVGNIHDLLLTSDPEMKAWMYWWGKTKSIKGAAAVDRVQALQRQYGPGADSSNIGEVLGKHLDVNYKGAPLGAAAR